ncbi:hypothetical protein [Asticcacaulis sp. EMRT-3]|uniref:hypothetical protein n=1 Tax=Asticcacaulis sp. EMRT-3 TaxID=3040349 RepID=UPI0024AFCA8F|nr:hypothetical protein [Asticcacaulis sp. EMRT-3]MDI7775580.1 hypothetical protein [Asticcacaulis sp. EMRT-3]
MTEHQPREKFATQMDSALLAELRALARSEGRQLQSLIEEAVGKLLETRQTPAISVGDALNMSLDQFGPLYKKLAE